MEDKRAKWNRNTYYALELYEYSSRVLGIWPLDNRNVAAKLRMFLTTVSQAIAAIIHSRNWIINGNCGMITDLLDGMSIITSTTVVILKVLLAWIYGEQLRFLVNSVVEDWANADAIKYHDIMHQYALWGRRVFIVQMLGAYMTVSSLLVLKYPSFVAVNELYNQSIVLRNNPVGPNCWLSQEISIYPYFIYYGFSCLHLLIGANASVAGDVFSFGLAMHICGQFELLYKKVEELYDEETHQILPGKLSKFSLRHTYLLKLADTFETVFNISMFLELCGNTLLIAAAEVILIWACNCRNGKIIMSMIVRMCLLYMQIFFNTFIGEQLSTKAEKLKVAVYDCPWYYMSSNTVGDMKFIMTRATYPFNLRAGKICTMNHESFKNIVRTMFSYFSVMRVSLDE